MIPGAGQRLSTPPPLSLRLRLCLLASQVDCFPEGSRCSVWTVSNGPTDITHQAPNSFLPLFPEVRGVCWTPLRLGFYCIFFFSFLSSQEEVDLRELECSFPPPLRHSTQRARPKIQALPRSTKRGHCASFLIFFPLPFFFCFDGLTWR